MASIIFYLSLVVLNEFLKHSSIGKTMGSSAEKLQRNGCELRNPFRLSAESATLVPKHPLNVAI
jgi:hypothetical protein